MLQFDIAEVAHILRQASDHSLLVLDSKPQRVKTKSRFIFESKCAEMQESGEMIKTESGKTVFGSRMYQVQMKLKNAKLDLSNGGRRIREILEKR